MGLNTVNISNESSLNESENRSNEIENTVIVEEELDESIDKIADINREELYGALLSMFYDCKMTQTALETNLKLFKVLFQGEFPNNFNQLSNFVLNSNNDSIVYKKKWHCYICIKSFEELATRYDRNCPICNTK